MQNIMKKLNLIFFSLLISMLLDSQSIFKVISVNGNIETTKSKVTLQRGVDVNSDERFSFGKPDARAVLINSKQGRVILTSQNGKNAFSKAAFAPAMSGVSYRGVTNNFSNLKDYFNGKILIIDNLDLKVDTSLYLMNEHSFFFIRYMFNGLEINKKLPFKNDTLMIEKSNLYSIDGKQIPNPDINELKLYFYVSGDTNSTATFISTFDPFFVDKAQIHEEVQIIIESMINKSYNEIFAEIFDYLTTIYCKIDKLYLESWLKTEFDLEK
ncbi:MAG: hypothetical protein AUJ98_03035 [Bacteroidetes bacterium CG2_30_33_31]|nr:MAG: hypothetical protein AUJ98_03035 [Bacteroidetes bacterium CG2_30_33_31]